MQKVAVFGNAGGGKSTLSRKLSEITDLPLYVLDKLQYRSGGVKVPEDEYKQAHGELIGSNQWVIDGFGSLDTVWQRLDQADSLVYVDLPIYRHFWWVTKRMVKGLFVPPEGWPEGSPILKSSLTSYQALWLCHKYLTPKYRNYVEQAQGTKRVYHLKTVAQTSQFLASLTTAEDGYVRS